MSGNRATQQQVNDAYQRAGELLHRGTPPEGVRMILLRRGWSEEAADAIIADVQAMLGMGTHPGRQLVRRTWIWLGVTVLLAVAGAAALVIGNTIGQGGGGDAIAPVRVSDAGLLVLVGCGLLIGAAVANLLTLVTAVRARFKGRHTALGPVIVVCICALAASVYGGFVLATHFKV